MKCLTAPTLMLLAMLPTTVQAAGEALPEAMRRCAGLAAAQERLACFDSVAATLAAPDADGAVQLGRWQVVTSSRPGGRDIVAEQRPLEPWGEEGIVLQISCRDDRAVLAVGRDEPVMNTSGVFTTVRVNDRLAPGDIWEGARNRQQALYPGNVREFLQQLPATGSLFIRLEGSRRWRFEGTYQLDGIADIRQRILAACSR
jgi:hypothetical protein